ncbi:MAG: oxidoreductase [Glaciihabitans sp.]|nr:oxidoreductase [Glaciihabitans sp.]
MIPWLDRITGRVTMYRLVLIFLLLLLVEALLLSLLPADASGARALAYDPLSILAISFVAVTVSYLSNRLLALVFRVRPHSESSIVTGLILAFLFLPSVSLVSLLAIALAAVIAMASKYVLAIRRRHVFNPAALGAFAVGVLLPANGPGWWIANPWLLPITVVGAFVILYRTRHLAMGITFVVVALVGIVVLLLVPNGAAPGAAIGTALTSFPIVFFAGFMLSEPLTLPPRRWQQLAFAAIVGLLFAYPIHIGTFYGGYPLALLIGNLLAFLVGQRRGIRLEYLGRTALTPSSWELSFAPLAPLRFRAGQFVELTVPHAAADVRGLRRTFSIASAPTEAGILRIGMRTVQPSSSFKRELLALHPGQIVTATSIGGEFTLPKRVERPILLVAGGIGITPFISQLEALEASGEKRDIALVYATSRSDELAYADRLERSGHPVYLVAPQAPSPLPVGWTYLGAGPITAELLLSSIPDARGRHAYVSGPPALVTALHKSLRRAGVRRITTDYFTGY